MFSLVKFDNLQYYVTPSTKVKVLQDEICLVKYKGSKYQAHLIAVNDTERELKKLQNELEHVGSPTVDTALSEACEDHILPFPNNSTFQQTSDTSAISVEIQQGVTRTNSYRQSQSMKMTSGCSTACNKQIPPNLDVATNSHVATVYTVPDKSAMIIENHISVRRTVTHDQSRLMKGTSACSTPSDKIIPPPFGHGISLPVLSKDMSCTTTDFDNSAGSSEPPSSATDVMNLLGNDWMNDSDKNENKEKNIEDPDVLKAKNDYESDDDTDFDYNNNIEESNSDEEDIADDEEELIDKGDDIENEDNVDEEYNVNEEADPDYVQDSSLLTKASQSTRNNTSIGSPVDASFDISSFKNVPPIDDRNLTIPASKENDDRTVKKYFCPYCKKLQTKFARHIETRHKSESEVKKFIHLPKGNRERAKIIETIRKQGNYLHNTQPDLNTGTLILCRQRQPKFQKKSDDYLCCNKCKGFFSKRTLRLHYSKCNTKHKKGVREMTVMSRRITGYIHECANDVLRRIIFPVLRDDEVTRSIKYDKLIVLYGNKLCNKYTHPHQHDMIRAQLRLLGRFKCTVKKIDNKIDDFTSIFDPQFYDAALKAVKDCAGYNPANMLFKAPAVATSLGTLLKKCGRQCTAECIKSKNLDGKKAAEDFLTLFDDDFPTTINKKVIEEQTQRRREKRVILPSKQDIQRLHNYLKTNCEDAMKILEKGFKLSAWDILIKSTLILVQMFNRRRAGEIERLLIRDYQNQETIDTNVNRDMYERLSEASREFAKKYVRLTIRGKLGRTVPVLLHTTLLRWIDTILKYRSHAGVQSNNEYVFGIPRVSSLRKKYLRACPLMRKFAEESNALVPSTLRGTTLRKHIATFTAMLGIDDNQVSDLANFMGHDKQIHKDVYRVPIPMRDVTDVSRLLQAAMGDENEEEDSRDESSDEANDSDEHDPKNTVKEKPRRKTHLQSSSTTDGDSTSKSSAVHSSGKRRSTSPYGKTKRTRWSEEEKEAVRKYFGDLSTITQLPTLKECQDAINKYQILAKRRPEQLKTWIDNQRKAKSRQITYARRSS